MIFPGTSSSVSVRREVLTFDLSPEFRDGLVTARYDMENTGPALKALPVIFVIQDANTHQGEPPTVTWEGKPVPSAPVDINSPPPEQQAVMAKAWNASDTVIDPVSGERYSTAAFFGNTAVQYIRFDLEIPANGKGVLEVTYRHGAAYDKTRYVNPVYHYQYLLLPAKGWAAFGPLEIRVKGLAPGQAYFASTLPMQYAGGEYRAALPGLPAENLAFAVMSRRGVIGNLVQPGPYWGMAFLILLALCVPVGIASGWLPGGLRSRGWALALGLLSGFVLGGILDLLISFLAIAAFPALSGQSYAIAFIGVGQGLLATVITTAASVVTAARRHKKRQAPGVAPPGGWMQAQR